MSCNTPSVVEVCAGMEVTAYPVGARRNSKPVLSAPKGGPLGRCWAA